MAPPTSSSTANGWAGKAAPPTAGLARHRSQRPACHCGIYILIFFHCTCPMPMACKSSCAHWRKKAPSSPFSRMIGFRWQRARASKYVTMSLMLHDDAGPTGMPEGANTGAAPPTAGAGAACAGAVPPPAGAGAACCTANGWCWCSTAAACGGKPGGGRFGGSVVGAVPPTADAPRHVYTHLLLV